MTDIPEKMQPTCFLRLVSGGGGSALEQLWSDGTWRLLQKVAKDGNETRPAITQEDATELRRKTKGRRWLDSLSHLPNAR